MGRNTVKELLRLYPERLIKLYLGKKGDSMAEGLAAEFRPFDQLSKMVGSDSHQGVVASVLPPPEYSLRQFIQMSQGKEKLRFLALDSIVDPHNFGAILRAAECFGVSCVIYSKNRGVGMTPVVSKVSSGASEIVPIITVSNLASALRELKESDFEILVADVGEGARPVQEVALSDYSCLVLGAEGKGPRPLILKLADQKVMIKMHGKIDSLNVSQAAAVLLSNTCV